MPNTRHLFIAYTKRLFLPAYTWAASLCQKLLDTPNVFTPSITPREICQPINRDNLFSLDAWKAFFTKERPALSAFFIDLCCSLLALITAIYLKEEGIAALDTPLLIRVICVYGLLCSGIFLLARIYRSVWRYASIHEFVSIAIGLSYTGLLFLPLLFFMGAEEGGVSPFVALISWPINILYMVGARVAFRSASEISESDTPLPHGPQKVLIIGANYETESFLLRLHRQRTPFYQVIGIIDDTPNRQGALLCDSAIIGRLHDLKIILQKLHERQQLPDLILISERQPLQNFTTYLQLLATHYQITLTQLPTEMQVIDDAPHPLSLTMERLLPDISHEVKPDHLKAFYQDKSIVIFGGEHPLLVPLVKHLSGTKPKKLFIAGQFPHDYQIIRQAFLNGETQPNQMDIMHINLQHKPSLRTFFQVHHPDIVIHLPSLLSSSHGIHNNLDAMFSALAPLKYCADLAKEYNVGLFANISNTKCNDAQSPLRMGSDIGEKYVHGLNNKSNLLGTNQFINVRHGTLSQDPDLGLHTFEKQVFTGKEILLPPLEERRFIMKEWQAAPLILKAISLNESAPKKGAAYLVAALNEINTRQLMSQYLRLSNCALTTSTRQVSPVEYVEKLSSTPVIPTATPGIYTTDIEKTNLQSLDAHLRRMIQAMEQGDQIAVTAELKQLYPVTTKTLQAA